MPDDVKLTKDIVLDWTAEQLKAELAKGPKRRAEIEAAVNAPDEEEVPDSVPEGGVAVPTELSPEETAEAEAKAKLLADEQAKAKAEADRVAAEKVADEAARAELLKAAGITLEKDAAGNILWIVQRYQAKDDAGNPIGSPTYFKVRTWEELAVKQQQAHENATRYADRLKNRKPAAKKIEEPVVKQLTQEELAQAHADMQGKDPAKAAEALKKITGVNQLEEDRKRAREAQADAVAARVAYTWMRKHINDFNPCEANANVLVNYIVANKLEFSEEAFDEAFRETESQLAPVEAPVRPSAPAPDNTTPAPVPPAVVPAVVPPAAPAPTVVAAAPVVPPAPAIPVAVVPRPGVNGGVIPGQSSGLRPAVAQKTGFTKAIINNWTPAQMRAEMAKPGRRAEIERVMNS